MWIKKNIEQTRVRQINYEATEKRELPVDNVIMPTESELKKRGIAKLEMLKELRNDFKGVSCDRHFDILERWIDEMEQA